MRDGYTEDMYDPQSVRDEWRYRLLHQVHILYDLLPTTQWIHLAAILVVFGLLFKHIEISLLSSWFGFVFLILLSRILINNYYRQSRKNPENAEYWFNWFLVGTTLYGVMWSATAILLIPATDPVIVGFTALILCGLAAGGVAVSSVSTKVFHIYAVSTMWPYAAFLIASGQDPHTSIGVLILVFFILISILAYHINNFFTNLIDLQLKTHILEKNVKNESEKRRFIEKALLDNTLEEGLADLIRQHSHSLMSRQRSSTSPGSNSGKEVKNGSGNETEKLIYYVELLNETVLNNIQSAMVFLKNLEPGISNESQKTNIQIIKKILHEARSAIEKSFGSGAANSDTLEQILEQDAEAKINLRRLLIYVTHDIPLLYKAKYITIRRKIDRDVPQEIYGNKKLIEELFRQLLINAYQYSDGGTITIKVKCLRQEKNVIHLRFEISDTGVGIPKEILRRLEEESRPDHIKGGLGIVKQLVENAGGQLNVQSTLGVGSTVTINTAFLKAPRQTAIQNTTAI